MQTFEKVLPIIEESACFIYYFLLKGIYKRACNYSYILGVSDKFY